MILDMALELDKSYEDDIVWRMRTGFNIGYLYEILDKVSKNTEDLLLKYKYETIFMDIQYLILCEIFKTIRIPLQQLFMADYYNKNKKNTKIIEKYVRKIGGEIVNRDWHIPTIAIREKILYEGLQDNFILRDWQE